VKRTSLVRTAAIAAALAMPILSAYTPSKIVATPTADSRSSTGSPRPQPQFLSHILAITDVLNQCGNPSQSDILQCPLVEFRSPGAPAPTLW
jgi:hypothetical protein